jgi:hypothetical protein
MLKVCISLAGGAVGSVRRRVAKPALTLAASPRHLETDVATTPIIRDIGMSPMIPVRGEMAQRLGCNYRLEWTNDKYLVNINAAGLQSLYSYCAFLQGR